MAVESAEDLASFFDTDEFALAATYTLQGGGASAVNGIFDDAFIEVEVGAGVPIGSTDPQFKCRSADVPATAAEGDTLTASGTVYTVRIIEPDGTGSTRLTLEGPV